jgi:RND superfamily putative drug exporter
MFVEGHGSGVMNYTPQPLMAPMIGLIIAVIYGLSTDYEVFLVSRMVEARERGMSTTEAIRIGTATTGRLITAAALVLAVVAGAFVFSDLVMMKYLAFGLLIALLLDATIVRMFLVPAIMKMLGDDCWWAPRWMKRLQNKIGLGEIYLPDERKRPGYGEPEVALVGATVSAAPVSAAPAIAAPVVDAPTTRFRTAKADDGRDIGSWLGELRNKARRTAGVAPSEEPTEVSAGPSITPVLTEHVIAEDATTAIPRQSPSISAEATRAIPVSRPGSVDSDVATEQLNARAKGRG